MNHDTLKNTIATLEKLRDAHCSQLDAGALAELEDVLRQLRIHRDSPVNGFGLTISSSGHCVLLTLWSV